MLDYASNIYLALILVSTVGRNFAQYPLDVISGPVHSVGSTIQSTFSMTIEVGPSYSIYWQFNSTSICVVAIQDHAVIFLDCSALGNTYYNSHSFLNVTISDSLLNATFTYSNIKNESDPITLSVVDVSWRIYNTTVLYVKDCGELKGDNHLMIIGGQNAQYNDVAIYTCLNSVVVVNNQYDKDIDTYSTTCQSDAQWFPHQEVDCWYPPAVNISVTQSNTDANEVFVSGIYVIINCNAITSGNPESSFTLYYKNDESIGSAVFLDSSYNGANISCQMRNNYVNQVNGSEGYSPKISLNVLYQPEPQNDVAVEKKYAQLGDNYTIVIKFNANPKVGVSDTAMYVNGNQLDSSKASITYQDTLHTYRYLLTEVRNDSFGTYILSTRSPSPALAGRVTNFTVFLNSTKLIYTTTIPESTSSSTESGDLSTAAVAAISTCVGIVVAIIVTSAVWWWMLKRMSKGSMNDEKKESAYEPTYVDGQPLESAYEVVNRETIEDNVQVASQEQTNVNSAYEVIR